MAYQNGMYGLGLTAEQRRESARNSYSTAQRAFDGGRYEEALVAFQNAYNTISNPIVLVAIGATLLQLGRYEEARAKYQEYLWADPTGPAAQRARDGMATALRRLQPTTAPEVPSEAAEPAPPPISTVTGEDTAGTSIGLLVMTGVGIAALAGFAWWRTRKPKKNRRRRRRR